MANTSKRAKRPDGLYKKSVATGRDANGRITRKYFYGKTLKEVDAKVSEYQQKLRHGMVSSDENATFREIAESWLTAYKSTASERTQKRYRGIINGQLGELGNMKAKDLKPLHLQGIINGMANAGAARKTMLTVKQTASQIMKAAMLNDILYRNVFEDVTIPKVEQEEREPITSAQRSLILRTWQGHRMGVPALMMLFCGLRRGEMLALTWRDIDLKAKTVSVSKAVGYTVNEAELKEPKTKAGVRTVPIPDAVLPAIASARSNGSLLFCPAASGKLMSAEAYRRAWESYMHYLNIQAGGRDASRSRPKITVCEPFTAHQLRHTYATMLYDAGVDVLTAQKLLGHADLQVTMKIYTHLSETRKRKSIDALNAHINTEIGRQIGAN